MEEFAALVDALVYTTSRNAKLALIADYLRGTQDAASYGRALAVSAARYAGFNLLLGDRTGVFYLSNLPQFVMQPLSGGVHAVSNASLDTPWPKLVQLKTRMAQWCSDGETDTAGLFAALSDPRVAADGELPNTGVGLERERFLSATFIRGDVYGTRCSTVLTIDAAGHAGFHELRFGPDARYGGETHEYLQLG